jgi:GNAT superfamily N-acetyltransferase
MHVEIQEETPHFFEEYARISTAFEVTSAYEVTASSCDCNRFGLVERPLNERYVKDYDTIAGNHPLDWPKRFDLSDFSVFSARIDGHRMGGVVVAIKIEGRRNLAVLWDIRVAPEMRRCRIGFALFAAVEKWAVARGCCQLEVETQNINVAACKFYASCGCKLAAVHHFAYPEFPNEIQFLWHKDLLRNGS